MQKIEKPREGEYTPYAIMYIRLVPDEGLLLQYLKEHFEKTRELTLSLSEEKLLYRYAANKWTIKELLVHITDDERIYAYRALRFARGDKTQLPGFEQDDFVSYSNANNRPVRNILEELEAVRNATITLFESFDSAALSRKGIADNNPVTVRALGYHIAGHELHHINIIKEKYLDNC